MVPAGDRLQLHFCHDRLLLADRRICRFQRLSRVLRHQLLHPQRPRRRTRTHDGRLSRIGKSMPDLTSDLPRPVRVPVLRVHLRLPRARRTQSGRRFSGIQLHAGLEREPGFNGPLRYISRRRCLPSISRNLLSFVSFEGGIRKMLPVLYL